MAKLYRDEDGLILRRARAPYHCAGGLGLPRGQHAPACSHGIYRGEEYVECLWEAAAYATGTRHTLPCADTAFGVTNQEQARGLRG